MRYAGSWKAFNLRQHNRFSYLWPSYNKEFVRTLLRPQCLVAARFEPVYSQRYEGYVDLSFERDGSWLIVPMVRVEAISIITPENPPLTWPFSYAEFSGTNTEAVEDLVTSWLRSITAARFVNDEKIRFFRTEERLRSAFENARSAKWIGAAPYADVLKTVAPAAYGLRFARNRRVSVKGENAANCAAVLSTVAARIDVDLSSDASGVERWFGGLSFGAIDSSVDYDVYVGPRASGDRATFRVYTDGPSEPGERIIELAEPIPTDVMLSFDTEDAPAALSFSIPEVTVPSRPSRLSAPVHGGGSAGCVRLVVRDDAMRFRDADVDAAETLARRLRAEGFDARVSLASLVDVAQTDIIHVFDLRHGASLVELLRDAEASHIPVVVTPYADNRNNEAISGASGSLLIPRNTNDLVAFEDHTWAFSKRKISNLGQGAWYDEASAVLLARASIAVVSSNAEAEYLKSLGFRGATIPVPAVVPLVAPSEAIGTLVGADEFVLIHAPIEPRMNQVFGAIAAQREGLPLVLLGPVADIEFYRYVNEVAGPGVILLRDDLTDGEIAGIYGRARVVADLSWSARGLHRLARGAAAGAVPVAPANGYAHEVWGELVRTVDAADVDGIAAGMRRGWEQQPHAATALVAKTAERCDPFAGLVAVVSAYQRASAVPA